MGTPIDSSTVMPLISVIIPTFDRATLLAEAIESVRRQEFDDYELIVVDDGSTDDTPALLARCADDQFPGKLRVLRQAHAGQGVARNHGIAEARGEYCVFLDSDDLLFPWSLGAIAEAIAGNGNPPVVLVEALRFAGSVEIRDVSRGPLHVTPWPDLYAYAVRNHLGVTGTLVARAQLLREVGGFIVGPMVGDGADLMLRLGTVPNMLKIDSPLLYAYRVPPQTAATRERWFRRGTELIDRYRAGAFPGGAARAGELRTLLARDAAYFSMVCLYLGERRSCLALYLKTLGLQLRAGNYRYLVKTPILVALNLMKWPKT